MIKTFTDRETEKNAQSLENLRLPPANHLKNWKVIGRDNIVLESMINTEYALRQMEIIFMMLKQWIIIRDEAAMENYIETSKMSEILSEEFMLPLGISAYKLA